MIEAVKKLIDQHDKITVLTHINPNADTLGTGLGIYTLLKLYGKQVEVVNYDKDLPKNLDFLPHFKKIKKQIDFKDSLVITCDARNIDSLGFCLDDKTIINIDHHQSNTHYGTLNVVDVESVSASQVAYRLFKDDFLVNKAISTCFYTALLSDTQCFTTNNVSSEVFSIAKELVGYGIDMQEVALNLKRRCSLASIRILASAIETLDLLEDGRLGVMFSTHQKMLESGATVFDTKGIVEHLISLSTVQIAVVLIERQDSICVSMRSKSINISELAIAFGGGGHQHAVGFDIEDESIETLLKNIKKEIKERGLLNET